MESKSSSTFPDFIRKEICERCLGSEDDILLEKLFLAGEESRKILAELMENIRIQGRGIKKVKDKEGEKSIGGAPIPDIALSSTSKTGKGTGSERPRPLKGHSELDEYVFGGFPKNGKPEERVVDLGLGSGRKNVEESFKKLLNEGKLTLNKGKLSLSRKGASILAKRVLRKIKLLNVSAEGSMKSKREGYGMETLPYARKFEPFDPYHLIDIEKTISSAMEKRGSVENITLDDLMIRETSRESKAIFGIIVDESGSMRRGRKIEAAIEAALSLWEILKREPKNEVMFVAFSKEVKEVNPWELPTNLVRESFTDIAKALKFFRLRVRGKSGSKSAYLITDSEPNMVDGKIVGFEKAKWHFIEEAFRMKKENIDLNIIMLGSSYNLKNLAREIARRNLGTVVFSNPNDLAKAVIERFWRASP